MFSPAILVVSFVLLMPYNFVNLFMHFVSPTTFTPMNTILMVTHSYISSVLLYVFWFPLILISPALSITLVYFYPNSTTDFTISFAIPAVLIEVLVLVVSLVTWFTNTVVLDAFMDKDSCQGECREQ